jgi:hypothetical protein
VTWWARHQAKALLLALVAIGELLIVATRGIA